VVENPDFFDPNLAQRLSCFRLAARKVMLGTVSGLHQSPHRGSSVEFAEYRRYQPGDDVRRLDWRAFGRSERYYVKEFEADTNLRLILVIDASGSMGFENKLFVARQIAATIGYLAIGQGDAAGLRIASEHAGEMIPPKRQPTQAQRLLATLNELQSGGATTMVQTLHDLAEAVRESALVTILSDCLFEPNELRSALEHLNYRNHDVSLFHVMAQEELQPTWNRPVRLDGMEGEESMLVDPEEIAAGYEYAVREYLEEIESLCHESAVDYQRVMTNASTESTLREFLSRRSAAGGAQSRGGR
jgi:uncharacterized protein (DUF58 family)